MKKYYLNPNIFFCIEPNGILLWDYKLHEQFLIDTTYFQELVSVAASNKCQDPKIAQEFIDSYIISETPFKEEEWGWDQLSKILHVGSCDLGLEELEKLPFNEASVAKDYLEGCAELNIEIPPFYKTHDGPLIDLPKPNPELLSNTSFLDVLLKRKTCRVFKGEQIPLETLSTILYYTFRPEKDPWPEFKTLGLKETASHKTSPSGGGRHPEEAYITIYHVNDLKKGLYHYRAQDHKLTLLREGDIEDKVISMNTKQTFSKGLSFGVYIVACFERTWWKYAHSRAYRIVHLDIGHFGQTLQLCATAANLQTWLTAAFTDSDVRQFLMLDGIKESPLLFIGVGIGTGQAVPQEMYDQLKKNKPTK